MEKRNTKQREVIIDILSKKENMFHPTAQDLVRLVLESNPTIGQATVYRNINKLVEENRQMLSRLTHEIRTPLF